jgi:hypothetical protein
MKKTKKPEQEWFTTSTRETVDPDSIKLRRLAKKITKVPEYCRRYKDD